MLLVLGQVGQLRIPLPGQRPAGHQQQLLLPRVLASGGRVQRLLQLVAALRYVLPPQVLEFRIRPLCGRGEAPAGHGRRFRQGRHITYPCLPPRRLQRLHRRCTRVCCIAALVAGGAPCPPDRRPRIERLGPPGPFHRGRQLQALPVHLSVGGHRVARRTDRGGLVRSGSRRPPRGQRLLRPLQHPRPRLHHLPRGSTEHKVSRPRLQPFPNPGVTVPGSLPQHLCVSTPGPRTRPCLLQLPHPRVGRDHLGRRKPQRLLAQRHIQSTGTVAAHLVQHVQQDMRASRQMLRVAAVRPPPRRPRKHVPLAAARTSQHHSDLPKRPDVHPGAHQVLLPQYRKSPITSHACPSNAC